MSISLVFCRISLAAGSYCNLNFHTQARVPYPWGYHGQAMAQRILSNFSLRLEDWTASGYLKGASQGCLLGSGLVISYLKKDSDDREGKKKKRVGLLLFLRVDFLRGESFWNVSYQVLLQPESQASPGQGADPQTGWDMTASWRSNPQAGRGMSASQKLGPWAGRDMSTSWNPWIGRSLSRLRCDNLPGTRSLGRLRQINLLGSQAGVGRPQGIQHDYCCLGLRGCNLKSLPVSPPQMGIDTMM